MKKSSGLVIGVVSVIIGICVYKYYPATISLLLAISSLIGFGGVIAALSVISTTLQRDTEDRPMISLKMDLDSITNLFD